MPTEHVFLPVQRGPTTRHLALIFGGFFVFMQLLFLDGWLERVAFAAACAAFLLLGAWLSQRSSRSWPQRIVVNTAGIGYDALAATHGVDLVPWQEVERMDLFHTDIRLPPHLRIGLRPGEFRDRLDTTLPHRLSMGWDINIPVCVDAAPEVVLETAERCWRDAGLAER